MIKLIKNSEIFHEISRLLTTCPSISILTAFLSKDAVARIFSDYSGNIEIITSLYQEYVEPEGLELLSSLESQIYIYSGQHFFHPKVYYFHFEHPHIIIGSSNFTLGGLGNNIELNVLSDEFELANSIYQYIGHLKSSPQVGILTSEALQKYKEFYNSKHQQDHIYNPPKNDLVDIYRMIKFEQIATLDSYKIVKIKAGPSSSKTLERWGVIVANKSKNVVSGKPWEFFPDIDERFQIQYELSGHSIVSFESKLTKSRHISGLINNLRKYGVYVKTGDIFCFEELQSQKIYRFWIENEKVHEQLNTG